MAAESLFLSGKKLYSRCYIHYTVNMHHEWDEDEWCNDKTSWMFYFYQQEFNFAKIMSLSSHGADDIER
jgi:hypothetical protein